DSNSMAHELRVFPLRIEGEICEGDDLALLIVRALDAVGEHLLASDVLVVTQKVVSKAEGRLVRLSDVEPSAFARAYAEEYNKDPRHVEVVLRESRRIVKMDRGVLVAETRHGLVCANAGVDASNVDGGEVLCLLPVDADRSAEQIRQRIRELCGEAPAVIITDTFGRAWRNGITNVAIGVAGMAALHSYAGEVDAHGYELRVTVIAVADEIAGAAELVMGKTDGVPVAVVRGYSYDPGPGAARDLIREPALDLFR